MPSTAHLHLESRKATSSDSRMNGPAGSAHAGCSSTYPEQQVNVITHAINVNSRLPICNHK
ncbi:Uncharacterised protein [Mycobacteroides abscessus subsp. massiliense]|nr:Uncharacterised protein [Mycobacteroides abscessus subsp. massiliense]